MKMAFPVSRLSGWGLKCLVLGVFLTASSFVHAATYYVKAGGTGNGSSWANASGSLETILNAAVAGDQIWVAKGTYASATATTNAYTIKASVKVYGGFAGTEAALSDRAEANIHTLNRTILTKGAQANTRIVTMTAGTAADTTLLDGFTVSGGNTTSVNTPNGTGVLMNAANTKLYNCIVENNTAPTGGVGVYMNGGAFVDSCVIRNNIAQGQNGSFNNNDWGGTGVHMGNNSENILSNSEIYGNANGASSGQTDGGGVVIRNGIVRNCIIRNNSCVRAGGGVIIVSGRIENSIITRNSQTSSGYNGCGITVWPGSPSPVIDSCLITYNTAAAIGAGIWINNAGTVVSNCTLANNTSSGNGAGIYLNAQATITNNKIISNTVTGASNNGGGIYANANAAISRCVIAQNTSGSTGRSGGIHVNVGTTSVDNSILAYNRAQQYGSALQVNGTALLTNCIVAYNVCTGASGDDDLHPAANSTLTVKNTVIIGGSTSIAANSNTTITVTHSALGGLIQGAQPAAPNYKLNANPFVSVDSTRSINTDWSTQNFRLPNTSLWINRGDNTAATAATDIAGNTRIQKGYVDIGAYESSQPGNVAVSSISYPQPVVPYDGLPHPASLTQNTLYPAQGYNGDIRYTLTVDSSTTSFNPPVNAGVWEARASAPNGDWSSDSVAFLNIIGTPVTVVPAVRSSMYGMPPVNPIPYTVSGFLGTDTFITAPVFRTTSTQTSPVGVYPVRLANTPVLPPEYDLVITPVNYNVTPYVITSVDSLHLTAPANAVYNGKPHVPALTLSDWNGPQPVLNRDYTFNDSPVYAGTYTVSLRVVPNGFFIYADTRPLPGLTYSIGKTKAFVTPAPAAVAYGAVPGIWYSVAGLIGTDRMMGDLTCSFDPSNPANRGVGTYPYGLGQLMIAGPGLNSYDIEFAASAPRSLTVNPVSLKLSADSQTIVYGDKPDLTYTIAGQLFYNDTIGGALKPVADTMVTSNINNPYPIERGTLGDNLSPNYAVSFIPGGLIITKRAITVKAGDLTKVAGQPDPVFTASVVNGKLAFDDKLDTALITRAPGEAYGTYVIDGQSITVTPAADASNYTITRQNGELRITRQPVKFGVIPDSVIWTGEPQLPVIDSIPVISPDSVTVTYRDSVRIVQLPDTAAVYEVYVKMNDPQGLYMFDPSYRVPEGYADSVRIGFFNIRKLSNSDSIIISDTAAVYNGMSQLPRITYLPGLDTSLKDSVLIYNSRGQLVPAAIDADTYLVRVETEGINTFAVQSDTFIIARKVLESSQIIIGSTFVEYDGHPKPVTVSVNGFISPLPENEYEAAYNGSSAVPSAIGIYSVKVVMTRNFRGQASATLYINRQKPKPAQVLASFVSSFGSLQKGSGTDVIPVKVVRSASGTVQRVAVRASGPVGMVNVSAPAVLTFNAADTEMVFNVSVTSLVPILTTDLVWELQLYGLEETLAVDPSNQRFSLLIKAPPPSEPVGYDMGMVPLTIRSFPVSNGALLSVNANQGGSADIDVRISGVMPEAVNVRLFSGRTAQRSGSRFAVPVDSGVTAFNIELLSSVSLPSGANLKGTVTLAGVYDLNGRPLRMGQKRETFILESNAPTANADYAGVVSLSVIDSFVVIDALANDKAYGIGSQTALYIGELSAGTQKGLVIETLEGATASVSGNKIVYDWSAIEDLDRYANGFTDVFSYRLEQANNASAIGVVSVTVGPASTRGSDHFIEGSRGQPKPSLKGVYADPFAKSLKRSEKKISFKLEGERILGWSVLLRSNIRLYSAKALSNAYRYGLFLNQTDSTVQIANIGLSIVSKNGTNHGAMVILPPSVLRPAGGTVLRPDSDFVMDSNGNTLLIVRGKFFGDRPKAYFEYKRSGQGKVFKQTLPVVKRYRSAAGEKVTTPSGQMDDEGNSILYLKLPRTPSGALQPFNLVIDSGCGLGVQNNWPLTK